MAIVGSHMLLYTSEPEALRAVLRDVFGFKYVDAGEGWLIFGLPPSEQSVFRVRYRTDVGTVANLPADTVTTARLAGREGWVGWQTSALAHRG